MTATEKTIQIVSETPTKSSACGSYKVVDKNGLYWGHYFVGVSWTGEKFVTEAASDGLPR